MAIERPYDIWVDFNDIHPDGLVTTYADVEGALNVEPAMVTVGRVLTAGDGEGNRCPATVFAVGGVEITLQLHLDRFQAAGTVEPTDG